MSEQCDVVVVGAGLAGLTAATWAARAGLRVTLVERTRFPRFKVCGGCLNPRSLGVLDRLEATPILNDLGAASIDRINVRSGTKAAVLTLPAGRGVTRAALDTELLTLAANAGVDVRLETEARVDPCESPAENRTVVLRDETGEQSLSARWVIAADGLAGSSRARSQETPTSIRVGSRVGVGCTMDAEAFDFEDGLVEMLVGPTGYVGVAAAEQGRLSVAAAIDAVALKESGSPAAAIQQIVSACGVTWPEGGLLADWKGTPPLTRESPRPVAWRLTVVGDAAGYVEPFTGEGMAWALAGGEAVGQRVATWLDIPACGQSEWPLMRQKIISKRQRVCRTVSWLLKRPRLTGALLSTLSVAPWLATPIVESTGRESLFAPANVH